MRGKHHVVQGQELVVGKQGFRLKDVQAGAGDPAVPQGVPEGIRVHELSAADIDQVGAWLHPGQRGGVDQLFGRRCQRGAEHNVIRALQELVQAQQLDAESGGLRVAAAAVVAHDFHPERGQQAGELSAHAAEAHDADRLAHERRAAVVLALRPVRGPGQPVLGQELVRERQEQRQSRHRQRPPDGIRGVGDNDAGAGAGVQVDGFVAGPEPGDQPQVRGVVHGA